MSLEAEKEFPRREAGEKLSAFLDEKENLYLRGRKILWSVGEDGRDDGGKEWDEELAGSDQPSGRVFRIH